MSTSEAVRQHHGRDESLHQCLPPDVVVWPTCREEVSEVAKICFKNDIPMIPFGAGSGFEGGVGAVKVDTVTGSIYSIQSNFNPGLSP